LTRELSYWPKETHAMADKNAIKAARKGTKSFERWISEAGNPRIDLTGADLRKCDLRWTNFAGANLEGVDFSDALLTGAYFGPATFKSQAPHVTTENVPANLSHATFQRALLVAATFNYAKLEYATFANAYLYLANFRHISFKENSFSNARLANTAFCACDLGDALSLETVQHNGPSHVDFETLIKSASLPQTFLQQVGLPETLIAHLPKIAASQVESYSCFISHATADKGFCDRLYSRMIEEKLRVWYALEDMRGGELLVPQLTRAITTHDKVIIVLSENSMQSQWVANELRWAHKRESKDNKQMLFPISLVPFAVIKNWQFVDPDTGLDIAAKLRSYFILDFSNWNQQDSFEKPFQKLLRDLRPSDRTEKK